jgi:hypothetical protein
VHNLDQYQQRNSYSQPLKPTQQNGVPGSARLSRQRGSITPLNQLNNGTFDYFDGLEEKLGQL